MSDVDVNSGTKRFVRRELRLGDTLRRILDVLAKDARQAKKEALADELEALGESVQRDFQAVGTRRGK